MSGTTLLRTCFRALAGATVLTGLLLTPAVASADPILDAVAGAVADLESATAPPGSLLPVAYGPGTAIVVLGYGLDEQGRMRPELVDRLEAGYVQAVLSPTSPIIVTGGNPRGGITEADAMAQWLIAHGVLPARIHVEPRAGNTIQNAADSAAVMHTIGADNAVLVTSTQHMPRAKADFVAAGVSVIATITPDSVPASLRAPLAGWH
jgi:uncharacterized SAM-binding protein YcdF (DUF218 family)